MLEQIREWRRYGPHDQRVIDHTDDLATIRDQVGKIRNDDINAVHFIFREEESPQSMTTPSSYQRCQVLADSFFVLLSESPNMGLSFFGFVCL